MNEISANALSLLKKWFEKADNWQKDLFVQLWQGNEDIDKLVSRAFSLIKADHLHEKSKYSAVTAFPSDVELSSFESCPVLLKSVSDVQGVCALAPKKPLVFGDNLTIVYGENGCGKSSYVRILKSAASPKNKEAILGNVYEKDTPSPQAKLIYDDDGEEKVIHWKPNMNISCPLNIYDTSIAQRFAQDKNEVIYEPHILSLLSIMVTVYNKISEIISQMISDNEAQQTRLADEISDHESIKKFLDLKDEKSFEKFMKGVSWSEIEISELEMLLEGLQNSDPSKSRQILLAQKELIEAQFQKILSLFEIVGTSFVDKYLIQRKEQIEAKQAADSLIEELNRAAVIKNTGSDEWKKMWLCASEFAGKADGVIVSAVSVDGQCALCQQELTDNAMERITAFADYMTSAAIKKSEKANIDFETSYQSLNKVISEVNIEGLENILRSGGISNEIIDFTILQYKTVINRCKWLLAYSDEIQSSIPELPEIKVILDTKDRVISEYNTKIKSLESIIENREKQIERAEYLIATQWIHDNDSIRKRDILLKGCISKCKTNTLTTLKKDLTQFLITDTYISRFQNEMRRMEHSHKIKVELVSRGAEKGRAYHQVVLKGAVQKNKTGAILSEGEFRVVSLAAFLADLSSWNKVLPFIFDDPITSLDQNYERKVAERLVQLSRERQVIVFTHRLAFAQLLVSCNDELNKGDSSYRQVSVKEIELRRNPLGEPDEPYYRASRKMDKALNNLQDSQINTLKKQFKNGEYQAYNSGIQALCSNIRKIVEQGIETDLLKSIVTRFDYSVGTQKIRYLHAITKEDIDLFDDMMTKYSCFEHSQSIERPGELPELDEIEADVDKLHSWCADYKKRCKKYD